MMVRSRLTLVIASLVIAVLLPGPALAAGRPAGPQAAPEFGLVGQEGGESYSVAVQGTYAYLGIGPRLAVMNVSVPAAPVVAGHSAPLPDIVQGIAVSGSTAYVADGASGLQIVDVTNPSSPQWTGSLDTPGTAQNVAVSGTYAYVADMDGGLRIVNVANPLAPAEVTALTASTLGGAVKGIAVAGATAYVGAGAGGLVIVDVTAPANPVIRGRYQGPLATNVTVLGAAAYVVDSAGLRVLALNVSNPSSPQLIDSKFVTGVPDDLAVNGAYLYVMAGDAGMHIFWIKSDTGLLYPRVTYNTPGAAHDVALSDLYAYVADGRAGLRVVDVLTNVGVPVEVGSYRTLGDALAVVASNGRAYVAAGEEGLSVMDLADPANPVQAGSVDTPGYAQGVALGGTRVYVADGNQGLAVVEVSNPAKPALLGQRVLPGSGYAWAVAVQGTYAYLAAESEGMQIVDVSNPSSPSLVGSGLKLPGDAEHASVWDVAVAGNYAYLAAGLGGVHVVDISAPAAPHEVAVIPSADWAEAVSLSGVYAYIADEYGGLRIADVTTPASPMVLTAYTGSLDPVLNVAASAGQAFVTTGDSVHMLDVSIPTSPVLRASHKTPGAPQDVAVGDTVLVADFDGGLRVLNPAMIVGSHATFLPLVVR
jgi:hypothetical protein